MHLKEKAEKEEREQREAEEAERDGKDTVKKRIGAGQSKKSRYASLDVFSIWLRNRKMAKLYIKIIDHFKYSYYLGHQRNQVEVMPQL